MFKFRADVDKMRDLFDGLYHFNVALIILTKLGGIRDVSKYSFIYIYCFKYNFKICLLYVWIRKHYQN